MKCKNILTAGLFCLVIFGFFLTNLILPDKEYSDSERRRLAQAPEISLGDLLSGKYMADFESYSMDQFPLRDGFRTMKAAASCGIFLQKDSNGFYFENGYVDKLLYPVNTDKLDIAADKIKTVYETCLQGTDCRIYLSIIPDKNYFTAPLGGYPQIDYASTVLTLRDKLNFAEYIDIFPTLSLADYYKTDQHWRQECIAGTAQALANGTGVRLTMDFTKHLLDIPFSGTYIRQSALPVSPEALYYLTDSQLDACTVVCFDTGKPSPIPMYDMEKAHGRDAYEMFLNGARALLTIENPSADTDRKLLLFRDSFGSSLAPLMVSGYSEITLVDLRYIQSRTLSDLIDFDDQDVLFLYSTLTLYHSISM